MNTDQKQASKTHLRSWMAFLLTWLTLFTFSSPAARAEADREITIHEEIVKAEVVEIIEEESRKNEGAVGTAEGLYQKIRLKILEGALKNQEVILEQIGLTPSQKVHLDQTVILSQTRSPEGGFRQRLVDKYRLPELSFLAFLFLGFVILLSGWRGLGSFLGMLVSLLVITKFIVPQILAGRDPLFISIVGSFLILVSSIYLAHGFSQTTTIAILATALTLILTGLLSIFSVNLTHLSGLGSDEALALQFGPAASINFKGLLLGSMIIGFLGVLDDITIGLSATIFELRKANPQMTFWALARSGLKIGREHINSLVNTLVLAYAGASLPIFLILVLNPQSYPLWFLINSEFLAEEVVRTLTGSLGLLLAVPITILLATGLVSRINLKTPSENPGI